MENTALIEKIKNLPTEKATEVEDFVDFLNARNLGSVNLRERGITPEDAANQRAILASFADDWNEPGMDVYDEL